MSEPDDPLLVKARQLLFDERVGEFNRLREKHPNLRLVLRGENLAGLDLAGLDLHGALLERVYLTDCVLTEACFDGATLLGCQARQGSFRGATFVGARFDSYKPLPGADTGDVRQRTVFADADLVQADLSRARLTGVDLSGANLSEARLAGAALEIVDLQGTILRNAEAPYLLLRGNTGYLAKIWGTAESPGPKAGEGPILENCNAFRVQLVNSTDASTVIRPDWRPDGTRNDDPRQNETARMRTKARNVDTEEEETTMDTPKNPTLSRLKKHARAGAIRYGGEETMKLVAKAVKAVISRSGMLDAKNEERVIAFIDGSAGMALLTAFVSSGLRMRVLDYIPMIPKNVRDLLQAEIADELETSAFKDGVKTLAGLIIPLMGEFGGALTAIAATVETMSRDEGDANEALPAGGNHPGIGVEQRNEAPVHQAIDKT